MPVQPPAAIPITAAPTPPLPGQVEDTLTQELGALLPNDTAARLEAATAAAAASPAGREDRDDSVTAAATAFVWYHITKYPGAHHTVRVYMWTATTAQANHKVCLTAS